MTPTELRAANTPADLERLAALADVIWREHYPPIIGEAQVDYMLAHGYSSARLAADHEAGTRFVLAWRDGRPVAFAAVSPDTDDPAMAWLDKLYVHRDARGYGIARRLIDWALETSRSLDACELHLRVNRDNQGAIAAYRRFGFRITAAHVKPIGGGFVMDDYLMARPVADQPPPAP